MARSVKKNPVYTDGQKGQKIPKRFANKIVRKYKDIIPKGKAYKKLYCSWNIHDYISRWDWKTAKATYEHDPTWHNEFPSIKEFYRFWRRYYKNK